LRIDTSQAMMREAFPLNPLSRIRQRHMAIYLCSTKIISRKQGRSAVAAAAYRAGAKLYDKEIQTTHNYTKKEGVVHTEILAPSDSPDWVFDREMLWNQVEAIEKRHDSQLAREVMVALPVELGQQQQLELLKGFVESEFVGRGMVADVCVHFDLDKEEENPHAHIMLSMRDISPDGFGKKNRSWNDKEIINHYREAWADHANRALENAGFENRIDHRTLVEQGIDRTPQIHLGQAVTAMKARGIQTERGDLYDLIEAQNELRAQRAIDADLDREIAAIKAEMSEVEKEEIKTEEEKQGELQVEVTEASINLSPPQTDLPSSSADSTDSTDADATNEPPSNLTDDEQPPEIALPVVLPLVVNEPELEVLEAPSADLLKVELQPTAKLTSAQQELADQKQVYLDLWRQIEKDVIEAKVQEPEVLVSVAIVALRRGHTPDQVVQIVGQSPTIQKVLKEDGQKAAQEVAKEIVTQAFQREQERAEALDKAQGKGTGGR